MSDFHKSEVTSSLTWEEEHVEQLLPGIPNEIALDKIFSRLPWKDVCLLSSVSRGWFHAIRSQDEQLFPGIPDEIALDKILARLPWKDIRLLSSVSRAWCRAIRSRKVYDARMRSKATEKFLVYNARRSDDVHSIFISSFEGDLHLQAPLLRSEYFEYETKSWGRCVTLDGKVYVFGGLDRKVHVLDVAGQKHWIQCAKTMKARQEFGCGTIDGKIYVFGGAVNHESMSGSKLRDSRGRRSEFRPIVSLRCGDHISRVRQELFESSRNGYFLYDVPMKQVIDAHGYRSYHTPPKKRLYVEDENHLKDADLLEVYDPTEDEWRVVKPIGSAKEKLFIAGGKFYSMSPDGVHVYDFGANLWAHLHSFSFAAIAQVDPVELWPVGIFPNENELLVVLDWSTADEEMNRSCLLQIKGVGGENKELEWQIAEFPVPFNYWSSHPIDYLLGNFVLQL